MFGKTSASSLRDKAAPPVSTRTTPAQAADATTLQPSDSTEAVRARAYFLWDQAGRPDGDGSEFWHRAEKELTAPQ